MSVKVRKIKKTAEKVEERINEGAPAQQPAQAPAADANAQQNNAQTAEQPAAIDATATQDAINVFIAGVMTNVKTACAPDAISKSVPQVKQAQDMPNSPYANEVKVLYEAVKNFANLNIDPKNVESLSNSITGFSSIITELQNFGNAVAKNAQAQQAPAQPAQQAPAQQTPAQPAQPAQQTTAQPQA